VGRLIFDTRKVARLVEDGTRENLVEEALKDLRSRLQKIYQRVNMNVSACLSITLETLLIYH
jgi:hypothetical protein